jgi:hypothetical protein
MSPILKKKSSKYSTQSNWSILQGEDNGKPLFVRRNNFAKQFSENPEFTYRAGFAIPLLKPNELGFPSSKEMKVLSQIEDELTAQLEKDKASILVLSITANGMREFVYYTRCPEIVKTIVNNSRSKFSGYEIQFYIEEDKDWSVYKQFAANRY